MEALISAYSSDHPDRTELFLSSLSSYITDQLPVYTLECVEVVSGLILQIKRLPV